MSQGDYLPDSETEFAAWFDNFTTQCEVYETELGLNSTTYGTIALANQTFDTKLAASVTAKEVSKGATADKNNARKSATQIIRTFANQWKSNPAISDKILNDLGIVATTTAGPVTKVTGLTVTGCSDGNNMLKWNRNGNAPGTNFIIESRLNSSNTWVFVAATTKTSYVHIDQIPGEFTWYRILSTRAGKNSGYCAQVSVYSDSGDSELKIAA